MNAAAMLDIACGNGPCGISAPIDLVSNYFVPRGL